MILDRNMHVFTHYRNREHPSACMCVSVYVRPSPSLRNSSGKSIQLMKNFPSSIRPYGCPEPNFSVSSSICLPTEHRMNSKASYDGVDLIQPFVGVILIHGQVVVPVGAVYLKRFLVFNRLIHSTQVPSYGVQNYLVRKAKLSDVGSDGPINSDLRVHLWINSINVTIAVEVRPSGIATVDMDKCQ